MRGNRVLVIESRGARRAIIAGVVACVAWVPDAPAQEPVAVRARAATRAPTRPSGWLGIWVQYDMTVQEREDGRVRIVPKTFPVVVSVDPGSPADLAGLIGGDTIFEINDANLMEHSVERLLADVRPGAKLKLAVRQSDDGRRIIYVTAAKAPRDWTEMSAITLIPPGELELARINAPRPSARPGTLFFQPMRPPGAVVPVEGVPRASPPAGLERAIVGGTRGTMPFMGPLPLGIAGMAPLMMPRNFFMSRSASSFGMIAGAEIVRIDENLAELVGVKRGILIVNVIPHSVAAEMGLLSGDILLKADTTLLTHPVVLARVLELARGRHVKLELIRKKKIEKRILTWNPPRPAQFELP